jgi:arabinogalactan endo-1,4-beta-galactosidase
VTYTTTSASVAPPSTALALAQSTLLWRGVDISHWNPRQQHFTSAARPRDHLLDILLDAGVNIVRFNVFLDGLQHPFDLNRAKFIADAAADRGLGTCVVLHLSDTWAYPSEQTKPLAWRNLPYARLLHEVQTYVYYVVTAMCRNNTPPTIVQIGNEISNGILWPHPSERHPVGGRIARGRPEPWAEFAGLLRAAVRGLRRAVREEGCNTKLMLHFDNGGEPGAVLNWFSQLAGHDIDYDIAGISIHDHWHPGGKLAALKRLDEVAPLLPGKQIVVAETSHPYRTADRFQAMPNDSDPDHSEDGQRLYLRSALEQVRTNPNGTGLFWWGAVFFNDAFGPCPDFLRARALFTPNGTALPALTEFRL